MAFYPVDRLVNDPANDFPACITPYPPRRPATQPQPGQLVRVQHCPHAYRLTEELKPGTLVRLVAWQTGQWTVEANGTLWNVPMTYVDPGQEIFVAGEWRHESHPLAAQQQKHLSKWNHNGLVFVSNPSGGL